MKLRYKLPFFKWLAQLFQKVSGIPPLTMQRARAGGLTKLTAYGGLKLQAKGVPNGYTVVDWVSNNANTLVPTGVVIHDGEEFEIEVTCAAVTGSFYLFQARDITSGTIVGLSGSETGNTIIAGSGYGVGCTSAITRIAQNWYHTSAACTFDTLTVTVETNGRSDTNSTSFDPGLTGRPTTDMCLFGNKAIRTTGAINRLPAGCKVEFAKLKINGTYVLDLKPVTRDSDGTPGFINLVDGTFLTATEGSLNAGPVTEIVPTPTNPIPLICNNGEIKVDTLLPGGYTRLEYLEKNSDGCYIDTGLVPDDTFGFRVIVSCNDVVTDRSVFGCRESSSTNSRCFFGYTNNTNICGWNSYFLAGVAAADEFQDVQLNYLNARKCVIDEVVQTSNLETLTSITQTFTLFGTKVNGSVRAGIDKNSKIQLAVFTRGNTIIQYLIPVKRNLDNVLGMYDTVSGTFLTNAGTGNFVAGPALGNIYCDGLTETLRISTKNLYDVNAVTEGKYIGVNGVIGDDNKACYSDLIKVKSGQQYTFSGICGNIGIESNYKRIHGYIDGVWDSQIMQRLVLKNQPYSITFTIPQNVNGIRISCWKDDTKRMVELGSSATTYVDYNNSTATTEMLLKLGDYVDSQDILNGIVNRQLGIQTLTGDETWTWLANSQWKARVSLPTISWSQETAAPILSNQFIARAWNDYDQTQPYFSLMEATTNRRMAFAVNWNSNITSLEDWQQWLQDQYNNGTPVIVVYPLATQTTEAVTPQPMSIVDGDNTLEIVQASLTSLELEAEYKRH